MRFIIAIAVLLVVGAAIAILAARGKTAERDERRVFTPSQKRRASQRCGGRCEHFGLFFRCRAAGTAGDHIYPWSKGGLTIDSNLQMLCTRHNLKKSAIVPSRVAIWRLEHRRRRYFPPGESTKVRWW